jgi:hypothetical protein
MPEDRLVEIRDLLAQLVQQSREAAKRQQDSQALYQTALGAQRRWQLMGLAMILPLVGLLLYLVFR